MGQVEGLGVLWGGGGGGREGQQRLLYRGRGARQQSVTSRTAHLPPLVVGPGASVAAAGVRPVLGPYGLCSPGLLGAIFTMAAEAAGSHHKDHEEDEQGPTPQRRSDDDHRGTDTLIRLCVGRGGVW